MMNRHCLTSIGVTVWRASGATLALAEPRDA
jgi:hypothetical protein